VTNDTKRVRWRMTFDELCYLCRVRPPEIDRWAALGAFGPRLKEPRDRGWHRHVDRTTAQRAVIMSQLRRAGLNETVSAALAATHQLGETEEIVFESGDVRVTVRRDSLP
jgi:hypothetical protein